MESPSILTCVGKSKETLLTGWGGGNNGDACHLAFRESKMKSHHWGVLEIIHKERSHFLFKAWSSRAQIGPLTGLNSKFQKKVRHKDADTPSLIIVLYSSGRFRPWATGWGWGFACLASFTSVCNFLFHLYLGSYQSTQYYSHAIDTLRFFWPMDDQN